MRKLHNFALGAVLVATALCSCAPKSGGKKYYDYVYEDWNEISFWSSFGTSYTEALDQIVNEAAAELGIDVDHQKKDSYKTILEAVTHAIPDSAYPNVIQGYPDHFANYLGTDILTPLDVYFQNYKEKNNIDLLEDYYPDYMIENTTIDVDKDGDPVITGVPFNKSTELMGYNGVFVDYCKYWCSLNENKDVTIDGVKAPDWHLDVVPATWHDWEVKGPRYRHIMDTLTKDESAGKVGKLVYGKQDGTGKSFDFNVIDSIPDKDPQYKIDGRMLLLNFAEVTKDSTRIIGWDATDNMFITLLRQWGSEYTELPQSQMSKNPNDRVGRILFLSNENKQKTLDCLRYFCNLNNKRIFGTPAQFDDNYCSSAFAANKIMFMICSSGGLSYNTPNDEEKEQFKNRFSVAPVPYYDDGTDVTGMSIEEAEKHVRKYVISQGANLTLSIQYGKDAAFDFMAAMTTGKYQAKWCLKSGYYPSSKSATNSADYQAFLNEAEDHPETAFVDVEGNPAPTKVAYREGSILNQEYYLSPEEGVYMAKDPDNPSSNEKVNLGGKYYMVGGVPWHKFVDPAFVGSSIIRNEVASVFINLFNLVNESNLNQDTPYINELMSTLTKIKQQNGKNIAFVDVNVK